MFRNFPSTSPQGGLYLEGPFNGGFFALPVWGGLYLEGLIHGGAYFRNFTVTCKPAYYKQECHWLKNYPRTYKQTHNPTRKLIK